jgi:hypothetical protein
MVLNEEQPEIMNWPEILPEEFDESSTGTIYSLSRNFTLPYSLTIGGPGSFPVLIEDKALMVFKVWTSLLVNNGSSGGGGEERSGNGDSGSEETEIVAPYYERYGQSWQRLETDFGYGGTLDIVPANDPLAAVFYKFYIGESGEYRVMAHVPRTEQPPAMARYEAHVTGYLADRADTIAFGEPEWTELVDLSDSTAYNRTMDEDGFIEVGTVTVNATESDLATVVIRLSAGEQSSRYLLADAIKLVPEEGRE